MQEAHCIYCGKKQDLSREHIIPLGLDGGFILPEATCQQCRDITGKFEQHCLRDLFGLIRQYMQIDSNRHKKDRKKFYVKKIVGSHVHKVEAAGPQLPSYIVLPLLWTPSTLLTNRVEKVPLVINGHSVYHVSDNMPQLIAMHGPFSIDIPYNLKSFARMLAKIGHALVVAEIGAPEF